jgi:hypothetical protein
LKDQAVIRLGYTDWSRDLDVVRSSIEGIAEKANSIAKREGKKVKKSGTDSTIGVAIGEFKGTEEYLNAVGRIDEVLARYNYDAKFTNRWVSDMIRESIEGVDIRSFGMLPANLLARYGAIDSIATRELFFHFRDTVIPAHSARFCINSQEGYELWKESMYGAYKLELNSSAYDMPQVLVDRATMEEEQRKALASILTSYRSEVVSYLEGRLKNEAVASFFSTGDNWKKYVESHEKFEGYTDTGKVRYKGKKNQKNKTTGVTELVDGICNVARDKVQDLLEIFDITGNAIQMHIKSYVRSFIDNIQSVKLEKLQELLNPGSDAGKEILIKLMYNEFLGAAKFIIDMKAYSTTEACKIDIANGRFNSGEVQLIELIGKYDKNKKPAERAEYFDSVLNLLSQIQLGSITASKIVECGKWRMSTVDEENMTELYEYYYVTGIDADTDKDKDTEFRILFYTRYYKKIEKIITTYVDGGKLGVSQVYVVDRGQFEGGELFVPRKRKYEYGEAIGSDEALMYQGTWNPNSVMTGRWASPIHTLPADSNPKRHLVTRFRGGCVAAPDFSQAELRVCGRAANDESLLGAYRAGIDVHLKTAQSIFGREEVTEVERRYAKMGCTSGETLIKLVNGQTYRVDELYERWQAGERDMQVPSFCPEKGVTVGRVTDVQLTKYTTELCKVTFTDGTSVTMTPDHPLLLKGREDKYVEGKDSIGAEIEPLFYRYPAKGAYYGYEQWRNTYVQKRSKLGELKGFTGRWEMTHQIAAREYGILGVGGQLSHMDNDKTNNYESNLQYMTLSEHASHTRKSQPTPSNMEAQFHRIKKYMDENGIELNEENYNRSRFEVYKRGGTVALYSTLIDRFGSIENVPVPRKFSERCYDYFGTQKGQSYKHPTSKIVALVEMLHLDEPVPVYDLSVAKYHNYVVDFDDGSGIFVHNTFQILYGGTPESFGMAFLNGEVELARKIFDGFFSAYPDVKKWMQDRYDEIQEKGYVTTMTSRAIYLGFESPMQNLEKIMRQAGNAPIQGASSDVAASSLYNVSKFIQDKNFDNPELRRRLKFSYQRICQRFAKCFLASKTHQKASQSRADLLRRNLAN